MVCANPDVVVRWGGRLIYCAGALAEIYERLGGDVVYGGKPHAPIYEIAFAAIEEAVGSAVDRSRILAIGDGIATDIAGADRNGFDSLFIAGAAGVHQGETDGASVAAALDRAGVRARFFSAGLAW